MHFFSVTSIPGFLVTSFSIPWCFLEGVPKCLTAHKNNHLFLVWTCHLLGVIHWTLVHVLEKKANKSLQDHDQHEENISYLPSCLSSWRISAYLVSKILPEEAKSYWRSLIIFLTILWTILIWLHPFWDKGDWSNTKYACGYTKNSYKGINNDIFWCLCLSFFLTIHFTVLTAN